MTSHPIEQSSGLATRVPASIAIQSLCCKLVGCSRQIHPAAKSVKAPAKGAPRNSSTTPSTAPTAPNAFMDAAANWSAQSAVTISAARTTTSPVTEALPQQLIRDKKFAHESLQPRILSFQFAHSIFQTLNTDR